MSVFSKIKQGRKAAKEHKAKAAEKEDPTPVKVLYKHVPTHAAVDALSGAPSTWKQEDRSRIREHHQRRSQMTISRTQSTLSTVSYANSAPGPSVLPRNASYHSYSNSPHWVARDASTNYSQEQLSRRRKSRDHSHIDSGLGSSIRPSPLASNVQSEDVSPVESSGNSTTSNSSDHLEIPSGSKRPSARSQRVSSYRPQPTVYVEKDIFDRLHTSTTRKLGEAPLYDTPPSPIKAPTVNSQPIVPPHAKKPRWSLMGKKNTVPPVA
ncbi:hypothetical protein BJ875DRAFT_36934 [Amylocarpus encephaloides]|uniref:Uncharacterized protein n=1 Tax=Amylocarpus encephaloides TaxID=45428 RepID=A0A9P8C4J4_9HELO|nr:hypothetical protein BJ875DRAFT_36934 [Amylocarpus encephaloides]